MTPLGGQGRARAPRVAGSAVGRPARSYFRFDESDVAGSAVRQTTKIAMV